MLDLGGCTYHVRSVQRVVFLAFDMAQGHFRCFGDLADLKKKRHFENVNFTDAFFLWIQDYAWVFQVTAYVTA